MPAAFLFPHVCQHTCAQVLYTANCHLEGSPYKPAERLNQLRSTLASFTKHQATSGLDPAACHVVVGGDLNSSSSEGPYRLLTQGWLPAGYREAHLPNKVGFGCLKARV
jgi:CCR4-NOT transcription complex subunit 6